MLKLSKSLPVMVLAFTLLGGLPAFAEGLNIYQPQPKAQEGVQDSPNEDSSAADEGMSPVNYPAMTPASSLLDAETNTRDKQDKLFPKIHQRNQSQPDLLAPPKTIPAPKVTSSPKKVSMATPKLRLSSPPSPLSPGASPDLAPIAWKRSEIPQLKFRADADVSMKADATSGMTPQSDVSIKPAGEKSAGRNTLQPISSLPAVASATLQPMMMGADDLPALRDVDVTAPSLPASSLPASPTLVPHENNAVTTQSGDITAGAKKTVKPKVEKPPRPVVYYTPLPAIAVFPVIKHSSSMMFSDVPLLFAKEFSRRLELQAPGTQVLNPYYTTESMKAKGIDHLYQKMMKEYMYAGRPDPVTLDYLLKQMTVNSDRPIVRVFFVEADLDINDPMSPKGMGGSVDRIRNLFDGSTPDYMKYYVRSHVQAYDTEDPNMPQIWNFDWKHPVRADRFNNVTTSVFVDADAMRAFNETSGSLSKAALLILPKSVYMEEHVDSSVQGRLAGRENGLENMQGQPDSNLEPGMHPIGTTEGIPGEGMENGIELRSRSGRPKRPVTESTRQVINQLNRWAH